MRKRREETKCGIARPDPNFFQVRDFNVTMIWLPVKKREGLVEDLHLLLPFPAGYEKR